MSALERIAQQYREAFRRHGDSPAAVLWPKGRQDLRFAALTRFVQGSGFSVLDFGCGLAHLLPYLQERFGDVRYAGVDIVPEFIDACRRKFPSAKFGTIDEVEPTHDYVLVSGAFNILYHPDAAMHQQLVFENLSALFRRATRLLSVNFMSDHIDYTQEGAYHQGIAPLLAHLRSAVSPRFVLDHSYLPYEYTVTVFKDQRT